MKSYSVRIDNQTLALLVQAATARGVPVDQMSRAEFIRSMLQSYAQTFPLPTPSTKEAERVLFNVFDKKERAKTVTTMMNL